MDLGFRTSSVGEKDAFYVSLLSTSIDAALDAAGPDSLDAIIMTGAPARGEATVIETPDGLYSMSDVDLAAVVADGVDRTALAAAVGRAFAGLNASLTASCPGADISFKTRSELGSMEPSISAYELLRTPVVVWGDESVLSGVAPMSAESIPTEECLKLVHNRVLETLVARPSPLGRERTFLESAFVLYRVSKMALDCVTAALFLAGCPEVRYADRVDAFRNRVLTEPAYEGLRGRLAPFIEELDGWASFKATGDLEALPGEPGDAPHADALSELAERQWSRYVPYATAFWRLTLGATAGNDLLDGGLPGVVESYRGLESRLRSLVRTRRTSGPAGLFASRMPTARSMFASPRLLAYITAMLTYARFAATEDEQSWIDAAIDRYCPFELPPDFSRSDEESRTASLIEKIGLFHEAILLGRTVGGEA